MSNIIADDRVSFTFRRDALAAPALGAFAVAFTALHFILAANIGLSNNEAYYRLWSLSPALSYYDHPPMVAWIIAVGRWLGGEGPFGIRCTAVALHLVGGIALYRTTYLLYDKETAIRTAWIALAMPLLTVGGMLASPDLPSVLFWTLTVWAIAELDHSKRPIWWLVAGLFAGCGLLSKYTNLFAIAGILIWLIAVPRNREWLRSPFLWAGAFVTIVTAAPVIIWNYEHDWVSFAKQFGRVVQSSVLSRRHFELELIGTNFGLASPLIASLACIGIAYAFRLAITRRRSGDVLICAAVLPALVYFIVHGLHDRVHFNWLAPLYPFFAISAARCIETLVPLHRQRTAFVSAVATGFVFSTVIFAHALWPLANANSDPLGETRGWKTFAEAVDGVRRRQGAAWIATASFATNAQLAYKLDGTAQVRQLNEPIRYVNMQALPESIASQPALYVERSGRSDIEFLKTKFNRVERLAPIVRSDGTSHGMPYEIFVLSR